MIYIRRVIGDSMIPTLYERDIVLAIKKRPKQGDIVISKVGDREVIKRVQNISPTALFLVGDNLTESTDSRSYGEIPITSLLGVVKITFNKKRPKKFIS
jgi:signal peptidase I